MLLAFFTNVFTNRSENILTLEFDERRASVKTFDISRSFSTQSRRWTQSLIMKFIVTIYDRTLLRAIFRPENKIYLLFLSPSSIWNKLGRTPWKFAIRVTRTEARKFRLLGNMVKIRRLTNTNYWQAGVTKAQLHTYTYTWRRVKESDGIPYEERFPSRWVEWTNADGLAVIMQLIMETVSKDYLSSQRINHSLSLTSKERYHQQTDKDGPPWKATLDQRDD